MPKRKPYLTIYLSEDERQRIIGLADQAGLPVSRFVKRVCLAHEVRSVVDQQAVLALLQCKGDLGRLGGLFKMHLSEPSESPDWHTELRMLLRNIETSHRAMAKQFAELAQALLRGKKQ